MLEYLVAYTKNKIRISKKCRIIIYARKNRVYDNYAHFLNKKLTLIRVEW